MEDKKKAMCEGEKQKVQNAQVKPRQEFDVASERALVGYSTDDDHNRVQSVDSSSDNDYNSD